MALTATATPRVARDIIGSLSIPRAVCVQKSFLRSNIRFQVEYLDGSLCNSSAEEHMTSYILARKEQTGIVYAHKRETVEYLVSHFSNHDIRCVGYHGGLTPKTKKAVQERFECGDAKVVIATV